MGLTIKQCHEVDGVSQLTQHVIIHNNLQIIYLALNVKFFHYMEIVVVGMTIALN